MATRYYQCVRWLRHDPDEPARLWAEVVDGWEMRKVDELADGRLTWADDEHDAGGTRLGTVPVPAPEEIALNPQFVVELVDREAFESVWRRARGESLPPATQASR